MMAATLIRPMAPALSVLCVVFLSVCRPTSAAAYAEDSSPLEQGQLYHVVRTSDYGGMICEVPMETSTPTSFVAGCQEANGNAQGWMSPDAGYCRPCPPPEQQNLIVCEQDGMEFLNGTRVNYDCTVGYTLSSWSAPMRICTERGWLPEQTPVCVSDNDPAERCPSDWKAWSECSASQCGESGVRVRERGKYFVYPGAMGEYYAQCAPHSGYGDCSLPCTEEGAATTEPPTQANAIDQTDEITMTEEPTTTVATTEEATTTPATTDEPTTTPATTEQPTTTPATTDEPTTTPATTEQPTTTPVPTLEPTPEQMPTEEATAIADAVETTAEEQPAPTNSMRDPVLDVTCDYRGRAYPIHTVLSTVCPPGWQRRGGKANRRCKADGHWHGKEPLCRHIASGRTCPPEHPYWSDCSKECVDIPGPAGIRERYFFDTHVDASVPGLVSTQCSERKETEVCLGNYECTVPCEPPLILNGRIRVVHPRGHAKKMENGTVIEVICDKFYSLTTALPTAVCHNGEWRHGVPACQLPPKHMCSPPSKPAFGDCSPRKTEYAIDEYVVCRCQQGYGIQGAGIRYCREGDRWTGTRPTCARGLRTSCGDPGGPENGAMRPGSNFGRPGSSAHYACRTGFELIGERTLTCLSGGSWNNKPPTCRYNYQAVSDLVHRLHTLPAVPCAADGTCRCMLESACPACARRTAFNSFQRGYEPCCATCRSCCLELVFALDESGSITDDQFLAAVNFTRQMVSAYVDTHPQGCLRVGAIKFSHRAHVVANLTEGARFAWPAAETKPRGGGTGIRCALTAAKSMLQRSRSQCRKVVFLITDGRSNHCGNPRRTADLIKCKCAEIYAVGIGSDFKLSELSRIASHPESSHVFVLRRFNDLFKFGAAYQSGVVTL